MKHLINNSLRTKNMIELLQAMGINLENTGVSCKDERVVFKATTEIENLAAKLQELLQKDAVKPALSRMTFAELISDDIIQATCNETSAEVHKQSCLSLFKLFQNAVYTLDQEQEYLEIMLPSPVYEPLFNLLTYKYIIIEDGKIRFSIKEYLKEHKEEHILIEGESPLLFIHADVFESQKVFYAQKHLSDGKVEVTPYFFVPNAITPPEYHFVLDTSASMNEQDVRMGEKRLTILKKCVLQFAEALFAFQPDAVIKITRFNTETHEVGRYRKADLENLTCDINTLNASGMTRLYATVAEQLASLQKSSQHNNILLFTDGTNTVGNDREQEEALERTVRSLESGTRLIPARNKLFIISYSAKQPEVLYRVAGVFGSLVINTNSSDFMDALSEKDQLQEWAAARELFTCRLEFAGSSNSDTQTEEYVRSYDMSGQFTALEPKYCNSDETLHLTIKDGNGKTLLDETRSFVQMPGVVMEEHAPPVGTPVLPGSAKRVKSLGVFSHNDGAVSTTDNPVQAKTSLETATL
ncbi:hypothetical protein TUM19329_29440 [Legionella antarctica]|uniref:VWFA domain-containing protein n=1 Tax=Legionella antarctica TaxID=2708020 RepID=A0A6F8T8N8_9GAMM|nr:vWA domain-containing protein [Legionella antarctica]BCA96583.1 hypothetical protein TUM19329_29440 [Legionella antarctica]